MGNSLASGGDEDLHVLGHLALQHLGAAELARARAGLVHLVVPGAGLAAQHLAGLRDLHALGHGLAGLELGHGFVPWFGVGGGGIAYFELLGWRIMIIRL